MMERFRPSFRAGTVIPHRRAYRALKRVGHERLPSWRSVRRVIPFLLVSLFLTSCSSLAQARTFTELAADAAAVSVPTGVTFVRQVQSTQDGPGFTTTTFREVDRQFVSARSCQSLERSWAAVLRRAHRTFRYDNVPHKFGAIGSLGIVITDRPENLGVTIGTDNGECNKPFIYAFDNPH